MRPNEVLKKPLASVNSFWVEHYSTGQTGMQVPCGNRPKVSQEGAVREIEKEDRGNSPGAVPNF
jgi:hypothetical protein